MRLMFLYNRRHFLSRVERRFVWRVSLSSAASSSSSLTDCLLSFFESILPVLDVSFLVVVRFRLVSRSSLLSSSCFTSPATGPVFFCTLGTTALVLPPTVRNVIFSPFGRVDCLFFFPLLHRCLKSQCSGNLSESANTSVEVEQT